MLTPWVLDHHRRSWQHQEEHVPAKWWRSNYTARNLILGLFSSAGKSMTFRYMDTNKDLISIGTGSCRYIILFSVLKRKSTKNVIKTNFMQKKVRVIYQLFYTYISLVTVFYKQKYTQLKNYVLPPFSWSALFTVW